MQYIGELYASVDNLKCLLKAAPTQRARQHIVSEVVGDGYHLGGRDGRSLNTEQSDLNSINTKY